MWRSRYLVIFVATFLSRLVYAVWQGPRPAGDSPGFINSARLLVDKPATWLTGIVSNPSPLFAALLAPFYKLIPDHAPEAYLVFQAVVVGAVAVEAAYLAERGWGKRAGLFAGLMVLLSPELFFWSAFVLSDIPFIALVALLGIQFCRTVTGRRALAEGALLAVTVVLLMMMRRAAFLIALSTPLALLWAMRLRPRRAAQALGAFFLTLAVAIGGGVGVSRLTAAAHLPQFSATQLEIELWAPVWEGLRWNPSGRGTVGVDFPAAQELASMNAAQVAQTMRDQSVAFIFGHPAAYARLALMKALVFWAPALPGWSKLHILSWSFVLGLLDILAVLALIARRVGQGPFEFAILVIASFTATSMITFTDFDQRYRLPASLGVIILAGAGLNMVTSWRTRRHSVPELSPQPSGAPFGSV